MKKLLVSLILLIMVINILPAAASISDGVSIEYIPPAYSLGIGKINPAAKLEVNGDVLVNETLAYDGLVSNANGTTLSINWGLGNRQKVKLKQNITSANAISFTAPPGVAHLTLFIYQDATGTRTIASTSWNSTYIRWAADIAPTLTTTANKLDIITCIYDPALTHYYCQSSLNFTQ